MTVAALLYATGCALGACALAGLAMWVAEWLLILAIWRLQ